MEFQGTKGEWEFGRKKGSYQYISAGNWTDLARVVVKLRGADFDNPEGAANAKLIAAAPELLEALQESTSWLEKLKEIVSNTEYERILEYGIDKNKNAINKALK